MVCSCGTSLTFYPFLHGNGNEQHIETLEDNVAAITDPDVGNEGHDIECCTAEGRERAESQFTPARPVNTAKPNTVC